MCEIQQVQLASRKHRHKLQHLLLPNSSRDPLGTGELQQQAGTWLPGPAGHLPACAAQPGEPRASPSPCLVPARLHLWATVPWCCFTASSQQGRKTWANTTPSSCHSRAVPADSLSLSAGTCILSWQAVPGTKQLLWSCGNVSFNACTSLHGAPRITRALTVQPPLHVWTRGELENHRIQHGRDTQRSKAATGCPWQRDRTNGVHTQ